MEVESWGGFNVYSIDKLKLKECRLFSWGFSLGSEAWARHVTHFNPKLGVRFLLCMRGERIDAQCLLREVSFEHRKEDEWEDSGLREEKGCQMAIARFLDRMCLALRASGL